MSYITTTVMNVLAPKQSTEAPPVRDAATESKDSGFSEKLESAASSEGTQEQTAGDVKGNGEANAENTQDATQQNPEEQEVLGADVVVGPVHIILPEIAQEQQTLQKGEVQQAVLMQLVDGEEEQPLQIVKPTQQTAEPGMVFAKQVVQEMQRALEGAAAQQGADAATEQHGETLKVVSANAGEGLLNEDTESDFTSQLKQVDLPVLQATSQFVLEPQTAEVKTVEVKDILFSKIIDQVSTAVSSEKTELYLQLKPDHLGGLGITLSMTEKGLEAKLYSNNKEVQNMLAQDMLNLQQTLKEKGINVVSMEIIYDQMSNMMGRDQSNREEGQWGQSKGSSQEEPVIIDLTEEVAGYPELMNPDSSVEYTA